LNGTKVVNTFKECLQTLPATLRANNGSNQAARVEKYTPSSSVSKILVTLEKEFKCSGICRPGLFFYSLPAA
jgi:hypothetical protein